MGETFNIYCDESCHLENDQALVMVLGAVWCPLDKVREISIRLREFKVRHGISQTFNPKWVKVSPAKVQYYLDLIDYFFDDDDLHFRAVVAPDKAKLRAKDSNHTHDDQYYKMYFEMLKVLLDPKAIYRIYIDMKDTRSAAKVAHLHDFLCTHVQDHDRKVIERIQQVRSREIEILQLTDLLIGAIGYANRSLATSSAKRALVARVSERSQYDLTMPTLVLERKLNLEFWGSERRDSTT